MERCSLYIYRTVTNFSAPLDDGCVHDDDEEDNDDDNERYI